LFLVWASCSSSKVHIVFVAWFIMKTVLQNTSWWITVRKQSALIRRHFTDSIVHPF
jgi:hypothetical protein